MTPADQDKIMSYVDKCFSAFRERKDDKGQPTPNLDRENLKRMLPGLPYLAVARALEDLNHDAVKKADTFMRTRSIYVFGAMEDAKAEHLASLRQRGPHQAVRKPIALPWKHGQILTWNMDGRDYLGWVCKLGENGQPRAVDCIMWLVDFRAVTGHIPWGWAVSHIWSAEALAGYREINGEDAAELIRGWMALEEAGELKANRRMPRDVA